MLSGLPTAGRWSLAHWGRPSGNSSCECVINRPRTERCKLKKKEMHGMDPMSKNWQKKKKKNPLQIFLHIVKPFLRTTSPPTTLSLSSSLRPSDFHFNSKLPFYPLYHLYHHFFLSFFRLSLLPLSAPQSSDSAFPQDCHSYLWERQGPVNSFCIDWYTSLLDNVAWGTYAHFVIHIFFSICIRSIGNHVWELERTLTECIY